MSPVKMRGNFLTFDLSDLRALLAVPNILLVMFVGEAYRCG